MKSKLRIFSIFFIIIIVVLSVYSNTSTGKKNDYITYHYYANNSNCFLMNEQYDSAIFYFDLAFSIEQNGYSNEDRNDFYNAAKCYNYIGDTVNTYKFLRKSIQTGKILKDIEMDTFFNLTKQSHLWKILTKDYDSLRNEFLTKLDTLLRDEIDLMAANDQKYRIIFLNTGGNEDSLKKMQKQIDAFNEERLAFIIDSIGFPGYKKIGTDRADILILHTSKQFREKYFPILVHEIGKGNINPQVVAGMIDQMMFFSDNKQLYGTVLKTDPVLGLELVPFKYSDLIKIDSLRRGIGLTKLSCFMQEYRVNLPYFFNFHIEIENDLNNK